jgi:hypothetical protein
MFTTACDLTCLPFTFCCRRRCSRYLIAGDKKGTAEKFVDNLPGFPDNIRYDGEGRYWIALSAVTPQISSSHQSSSEGKKCFGMVKFLLGA